MQHSYVLPALPALSQTLTQTPANHAQQWQLTAQTAHFQVAQPVHLPWFPMTRPVTHAIKYFPTVSNATHLFVNLVILITI